MSARTRSRSRWSRRPGAMLVAAALVAGLATTEASWAPPASAQAQLQPRTGGITWGACPAVAPGATRDPRTECGRVQVPLDYAHPAGSSLELAVSRLRATGPGTRRGVLLVNPGGPGNSGLDLPTLLSTVLPADVTAGYDLVGFDPRGVRNSSPLTCGLTAPEVIEQLPFPAPDGAITADVRVAESVAARCAAVNGERIRSFTTANTARDMDRIRAALGERRLSYYGISAGTYLGAVYASLFPGRTDRMVLDSSVDPRRIWYGQWQLWGPGFAARYPDLLAYSAEHPGTAGFGATAAEVDRAYRSLAARLDRRPVDVGAPVPLSGNLLRAITFTFSYSDAALDGLMQVWRIAAALAAGTAGDAERAGMAALVESAAPAEPGLALDNALAAAYANVCGDVRWDEDVSTYQAAVDVDRGHHPLTAGMPANIWPCAFWRYRPVEPPVHIRRARPHEVLVLQNERDPATPVRSGTGMARTLGRHAALVRVARGGHVVITDGDACVGALLSRFLVGDGAVARRVRCP